MSWIVPSRSNAAVRQRDALHVRVHHALAAVGQHDAMVEARRGAVAQAALEHVDGRGALVGVDALEQEVGVRDLLRLADAEDRPELGRAVDTVVLAVEVEAADAGQLLRLGQVLLALVQLVEARVELLARALEVLEHEVDAARHVADLVAADAANAHAEVSAPHAVHHGLDRADRVHEAARQRGAGEQRDRERQAAGEGEALARVRERGALGLEAGVDAEQTRRRPGARAPPARRRPPRRRGRR